MAKSRLFLLKLLKTTEQILPSIIKCKVLDKDKSYLILEPLVSYQVLDNVGGLSGGPTLIRSNNDYLLFGLSYEALPGIRYNDAGDKEIYLKIYVLPIELIIHEIKKSMNTSWNDFFLKFNLKILSNKI